MSDHSDVLLDVTLSTGPVRHTFLHQTTNAMKTDKLMLSSSSAQLTLTLTLTLTVTVTAK